MRAREVGRLFAWGAAVLSACGGHITTEPAAGGAGQSGAGQGGAAQISAGAPSAGAAASAGDETVAGGPPSGGSSGAPSPAAGSGGSTPVADDVNAVLASPGCNSPMPQHQILGAYSEYFIGVGGHTLDPTFSVMPYTRDYFVWLPKDYDDTKPYRVTFLYMGCGDRTAAATATYKLMNQDPESVYVALDMAPAGLPPLDRDCFDVTVGLRSVEWEAMAAVADAVRRTFCVDEHRLFVAGYSVGASVANMFGCYFAGKDPTRKFGADLMIRGQSGVAGVPVSADIPCGGKTAALWVHDTDDTENLLSGNQSVSLPRVLAANGCVNGAAGPHTPWGSTAVLRNWCTQYTACPADYPVVFCTSTGRGHSGQDDVALPGFIEFQNLMNPH